MKIEDVILQYRDFQKDVSREADRLGNRYANHMQCRKGCSSCCTDISLLPLEWYALSLEALELQSRKHSASADPERCSLLKDDSCLLYNFRPLICRSHGLPLIYLIEEFDRNGNSLDSNDPEWQLSWCDLNFTEVDEDNMEEIFEPEEILNMEEWNARLRILNEEFLKTPEGLPFKEKSRIPLQDIFKN